MNWIQIIIPIFTGIGGYLVKHYLTLKKENADRRFQDKREHYRNLILCLKSLKEGKSDNLKFLWFEYSFLWLHAPDAVINSFNKLFDSMQAKEKLSEDISLLIGDLLIAIRRDMGFTKTSLKSNDFKGRLNLS